ncbi:pseudouridine synthase [Hyaloscypha variabilis F]|uniref:tRNA pseudouridine(55) synthase n=1 Tax=Hyaloscypha variabilis (strain UAMH 11265 / GT02V1 / F) TaxID=1149755 RepID=A0A2J6RRY1_HYAVF|nr:pseudouridine synthase [Hyaloscypha variabilis F]
MSAKHFWRMTQGKVMEGVFAINKPTGLSSAQVLRDLQKHFNPSELFAPWIELEKNNRAREKANQRKRRKDQRIQVKIGHGGTLDPLATGVLITGIGKGTKSLQDFLLCTKVYETVVLFGTSTDTYDRVGKVLGRAPYDHVTKEVVEKALEQFRGKFMQLPPLYSALKMDGKPLYEYAREGKEIPRKIERREVEVLDLELVEWMEGGTHSHKPPTDEAGHAEVNLANKVWKQENVLPAGTKKEEDSSPSVKREDSNKSSEDEALEAFERKKRKLSEDQDDLVRERPPSKRKVVTSSQDATMSGGLPPPALEVTDENGSVESEGALSSDEVPKATIEKSPTPTVKGPPAVKLRMTVTSGFYVRSLCHDLGAAVGSAATMAELKRTRQGDFELGKNVLEYDDLAKGEAVWAPQVEAMLDEWYEQDSRRPRTERVPERNGGGEREERRDDDRRASDHHRSRRGERDDRGGNRRLKEEQPERRVKHEDSPGKNDRRGSNGVKRERSIERPVKHEISPGPSERDHQRSRRDSKDDLRPKSGHRNKEERSPERREEGRLTPRE